MHSDHKIHTMTSTYRIGVVGLHGLVLILSSHVSRSWMASFASMLQRRRLAQCCLWACLCLWVESVVGAWDGRVGREGIQRDHRPGMTCLQALPGPRVIPRVGGCAAPRARLRCGIALVGIAIGGMV